MRTYLRANGRTTTVRGMGREDPLHADALNTVKRTDNRLDRIFEQGMEKIRIGMRNLPRWLGYNGPKESFRMISTPEQIDRWEEVRVKEQRLEVLQGKLTFESNNLKDEKGISRTNSIINAVGLGGAVAAEIGLAVTEELNIAGAAVLSALAVLFATLLVKTALELRRRQKRVEQLTTEVRDAGNEFHSASTEYDRIYPHFRYNE